MEGSCVPMPLRTRKQRRQDAARPPLLAGIGLITLFFGAGLYWAYAPSHDRAVVGPGTVVVDSRRTAVHHPTGGVVERVAVREGDTVAAGDVLLRLDGTRARADLERLEESYYNALALQARLTAERDGAPAIIFPPDLSSRSADPRVAAAIKAQRRIFDERTRPGQPRTAPREHHSDETADLREVQAFIFTLSERLRIARLTLAHLEVTAPQAGRVVNLGVQGSGRVITPDDVLLEIVPQDTALVVEARLRPEDVDDVHPGMPAEVALAPADQDAADRGPAPKAEAQVLSVSADRLIDEATGRPYVPSKLSLRGAHLAHLTPGMPAVAYIRTQARSALESFLAPAEPSGDAAFRED